MNYKYFAVIDVAEAYRTLKANEGAQVCFNGSGWMGIEDFAQTEFTVEDLVHNSSFRIRTPEATYKAGDIFLMEGEKYIFARTEYGKYSMIRLRNGNRFLNQMAAKNLGAEEFNKDFITQLFGNISDWEKIPS